MTNKKIESIYSLRHSFSIIGLTGRTGAGVSVVSNILSDKFSEIENIQPLKTSQDGTVLNNKMRRYNTSFNYAKENWKIYTKIDYKDVILLHLIRTPRSLIKSELESSLSTKILSFFEEHDKLINEVNSIRSITSSLKDKNQLKKLAKLYFGEEFKKLSIKVNNLLRKYGIEKRILLFQSIANNIRQCGTCFKHTSEDEIHIYTIAETINRLIKGHKLINKETHIVIDSLRNSLEIMFFKERYSAFYMISINSAHRRAFLRSRYSNDTVVNEILKIDELEYKGKGVSEGNFYVQDVQNCIQKSDIHFNYNPPIERRNIEMEFSELEKWSKYYLVGQIIKYTGLILHPGLITPSAQERCMQIAYVAKSNSGCISRQVGAVITDSNFSIKSIGWNDVPNNMTPCLLRNIGNLKNGIDLEVYSPYEKEEKYNFIQEFKSYYSNDNDTLINGLNCAYCFKDFQNYFEQKENQVHTRSLHAEENAMLQISKYGGQPLNGGILFTTASPCELCAKKARQLEITQIYYIDPYPGISIWHILRGGNSLPDLILFSGAIGSAYHKLYDPIMAYKEEMAIILNKRPKEDFKRKHKAN